jgi:hypothetical protein
MFTQWNLKEAKKDFDLGRLTSFDIEFLFGSYRIVLRSIGGYSGYLVDYRDNETRDFKDLNSVIKTLQKVGFDCHKLTMGVLL